MTKCELVAYTVLAYPYSLLNMMRIDAKAMPTNDINYSYHIKAV